MMIKKSTLLFSTLILFFSIYQINKTTSIKPTSSKIRKEKVEIIGQAKKREIETPIALIQIPKIKIKQPLYAIHSKKNSVEENIAILKGSTMPDQPNTALILAAHSGIGANTFFNELDQLKIKDQIQLFYNKIEYTYEIIKMYEEKKNGKIHFQKKEENQLILTTCSRKDSTKQYIIIANLKDKK